MVITQQLQQIYPYIRKFIGSSERTKDKQKLGFCNLFPVKETAIYYLLKKKKKGSEIKVDQLGRQHLWLPCRQCNYLSIFSIPKLKAEIQILPMLPAPIQGSTKELCQRLVSQSSPQPSFYSLTGFIKFQVSPNHSLPASANHPQGEYLVPPLQAVSPIFLFPLLYIPPFLHIFLPGFLAHSLDILFTEK